MKKCYHTMCIRASVKLILTFRYIPNNGGHKNTQTHKAILLFYENENCEKNKVKYEIIFDSKEKRTRIIRLKINSLILTKYNYYSHHFTSNKMLENKSFYLFSLIRKSLMLKPIQTSKEYAIVNALNGIIYNQKYIQKQQQNSIIFLGRNKKSNKTFKLQKYYCEKTN